MELHVDLEITKPLLLELNNSAHYYVTNAYIVQCEIKGSYSDINYSFLLAVVIPVDLIDPMVKTSGAE